METRKAIVNGPHLVSAEAAPPPSDPDLDHEIAAGVKAYQRLQQQIDKELFSATPDLDLLNSLLQQRNLVGDRLAARGIRVRA